MRGGVLRSSLGYYMCPCVLDSVWLGYPLHGWNLYSVPLILTTFNRKVDRLPLQPLATLIATPAYGPQKADAFRRGRRFNPVPHRSIRGP